ncbi:hypothetical protein [Bradyrhizobium sp. CCBAU 51627]|uniref:hypothetical protein n=1 Tax=Bradyrhizobium sp. CCBAU 51627 TaxID=1325088 RepID=UPI002305C8B6|nr:hypothetical protein [Bradyrhizobium sp. CCBAU 51627]MDA9436097.1 hypothetical protein [Bradyrhizobium sp. CCBAU 51627]
MDDCRDLVTVSLVLLCAGIMLVAGQLYIERHAPDFGRKEIETPAQPAPPPMVSHALQPNVSEPVQGLIGKRPT